MGYDASNSAVQRAMETGGSDSTYCPDYFQSGSITCVMYVGGYYNGGGHCGLWCVARGTSSVTGSDLGGRLLYIPSET